MTDYPVKRRKKLIEVAIPLEAINSAADKEKRNPFLKGHPRSVHLWFAPRPLPVARGVLFCQCVDDPSDIPEEFGTAEAVETERRRLFDILEAILDWDSIGNNAAFNAAEKEIYRSWERYRNDNQNLDTKENPSLPSLLDPFAGGGAIPLEAMRLGLGPIASDLNPIPYLINKAKIEAPARFNLKEAVSSYKSGLQGKILTDKDNLPNNLVSIANDIRHYSKKLGEVVKQRVNEYYPDARRHQIDLEQEQVLPVCTYLWARSVESPDPAFKGKYVPLISSFILSNKKGSEAYLQPKVNIFPEGQWELDIVSQRSEDIDFYKKGTKRGRGASFQCILSGSPITSDYIYGEATQGRMRDTLIALQVLDGKRKIFLPAKLLSPSRKEVKTEGKVSSIEMPSNPRWFSPPLYGIKHFSDLFTPRQILMLQTASDLISEIGKEVKIDAIRSGLADDKKPFEEGGDGATAYAEIISLYLALLVGKMSDYHTSCSTWNPTNQNIGHLFAKNAIPMTWDYPEANPFVSGVSFERFGEIIAKSVEKLPDSKTGNVMLCACQDISRNINDKVIISTDPPYYDNIGYADLSDFFYQWLRAPLKEIFPAATKSLASPKASELVATPYRHGNKKEAEKFFLEGMIVAMQGMSTICHPGYPISIYYAFKQSEKKKGAGTASTGWEVFLEAIIKSGLFITGTWPMRTEREARSIGLGTNALASSIVLVCRKKNSNAQILTRQEFRRSLRTSLPQAIKELERSNIAPVDVAQASIGPGMSIFSQARAVLNPDDSMMSVRDALIEINNALDEYLAEDEGSFDADTRFALTFFESYGYEEQPYGDAEGLAVARNVSVQGVTQAGILSAIAGKAQLLRREQLDADWDPSSDDRLCVWEATQHLIKKLDAGGEASASALLAQLTNLPGQGDLAANCRALAYRLYNHCEKTKQTEEARAYNGLVIAWPELERLAAFQASESAVQTSLI